MPKHKKRKTKKRTLDPKRKETFGKIDISWMKEGTTTLNNLLII